MALIEMEGKRFGRLTVLCRAENSKQGQAQWMCRCDCGTETIVRGVQLRNGKTSSCGCLRRERLIASHTKHGMKHTTIYHRWLDMKQRCYNPKNKRYGCYGGRGIKVCDDWLNDFQAFYDWAMANGYKDDLSIDRINVNGNYEPANCRWVTDDVQISNKVNTIRVTLNGVTKTLPEWEKETGIKQGTLLWRYHKGYPPEKILQKGAL